MENQKVQHFVEVPGTTVSYPETLIRGSRPGKRVTVSAGVHSREYIGIEAVIRLTKELEPDQVCGQLRLIPAINYSGLIARSADVCPEDGENLNRDFPGDPEGGSTRRLAAFLEKEVTADSDFLIDLHSGGFCEALTPHIYFHGAAAPEVNRQSEALSAYADVTCRVRSTAKNGFYSYAGQLGVPAIILERGDCGLWSEKEVEEDLADVKNLLRYLGVLEDGVPCVRHDAQLYPTGWYEDAPVSGCWYPAKKPGDPVEKGEVLGRICDIFGKELFVYRAKDRGRILYQTASLGIEEGSPMVAYAVEG